MPERPAGRMTLKMVSQWVAPQGQRGLLELAGDAEDGVLGDGADGGHGHEGQHQRGVQEVEARGDVEHLLEERGHDHHAEEADDDRGQCRQELDHGLDVAAHAGGGDLGQVDGRHHAQGDGDGRGQGSHRHRAHEQREDAEVRRIGGGVPRATEQELEDRVFLEDGQTFHEQEDHDQEEDEDGRGRRGEEAQLDGTFLVFSVEHSVSSPVRGPVRGARRVLCAVVLWWASPRGAC